MKTEAISRTKGDPPPEPPVQRPPSKRKCAGEDDVRLCGPALLEDAVHRRSISSSTHCLTLPVHHLCCALLPEFRASLLLVLLLCVLPTSLPIMISAMWIMSISRQGGPQNNLPLSYLLRHHWRQLLSLLASEKRRLISATLFPQPMLTLVHCPLSKIVTMMMKTILRSQCNLNLRMVGLE